MCIKNKYGLLGHGEKWAGRGGGWGAKLSQYESTRDRANYVYFVFATYYFHTDSRICCPFSKERAGLFVNGK